MASPRLEQAAELVTTIRSMLDTAGLEKAHATMDAAEVASGSRYGVAVVSPPALDFSGTWGSAEALWEVHVIAGPATDYLAAWEKIDRIIEALIAGNLNIRRAEVAGYQQHQGEPLPAYTLTLNPLD